MIFGSKKIHITLLAVLLTAAAAVSTLQLSVRAAAADTPVFTSEEIEAYLGEHGEDYYAYMILDEAEESLKPIILEARWRIISRESWVDDSINGYIQDEAGNIIEVVPHFHEVFPADWEIQPGRGLY